MIYKRLRQTGTFPRTRMHGIRRLIGKAQLMSRSSSTTIQPRRLLAKVTCASPHIGDIGMPDNFQVEGEF